MPAFSLVDRKTWLDAVLHSESAMRAFGVALILVLALRTAEASPPAQPQKNQLPPGTHRFALPIVERVFGQGPRRGPMFEALAKAAPQLQAAGVERIFLGGSFVTDKQAPGDLDMLVEGRNVDWNHVIAISRAGFSA